MWPFTLLMVVYRLQKREEILNERFGASLLASTGMFFELLL